MKREKKILSFIFIVAMLVSTNRIGFEVKAEEQRESSPINLEMQPYSEEYVEYVKSGRKGTPVSSVDLSYLSENYAKLWNRRNTYQSFPELYDLREYGKVPVVENQWDDGTCMSFSALGSAETSLVEQFPHISLSKAHTAWFTHTGKEEQEYSGEKNPDPYHMGSTVTKIAASLAAWKGPVSSELVPYGTNPIDESLRYQADFHLQNVYFLENNEEESLDSYMTGVKNIVINEGGITVNYNILDYKNLNPETSAIYTDKKIHSNHSVVIVGWDDHYAKENFLKSCQPKHDGAWLIRNSWGTSYGEDGYFWLSYEDQTIEASAFYKLEAADNYAHNYQYDTLGWCVSVGVDDSKQGYIANVFTAEEDEQLDAVSFYTTDAGAQYEISIYTGIDASNLPVSGKKDSDTTKGMEISAGFHTVKLKKPVMLKKGEKFSVVIHLENPENAYPIAAESVLLPYDKETPQYMGNGKESYASRDGVNWEDVAGVVSTNDEIGMNTYVTNVCIKAYTNPIASVSFSLMEGPIALGSELYLSASGADDIFYTMDGSDPDQNSKHYEKPITIDQDMTIKAVAYKDGVSGIVKEKTYTQADSELVSLSIKDEGQSIFLDISDVDHHKVVIDTMVAYGTENLSIKAEGAGNIEIMGETISSSKWYEAIPLTAAANNKIDIVSREDGKTPVTYELNIYRNVITFHYKSEVLTYDDSFEVYDEDGKFLPSGSSITSYIADPGEDITWLTVKNKQTGATYQEYVPGRPEVVLSPIDFVNECTELMFMDWNEVATKPDMSDAVRWDGSRIPLTPGQDIYLRSIALDYLFASPVKKLEVPERPETPKDPSIDYQTMMTKEGIPENVMYAFDEDGNDAKMGTGEPISVEAGSTLYLVIPPTDQSFASEVREIKVADVPDTPESPTVESTSDTSITLKEIAGAEYSMDQENWQTSPVFEGLKPETSYTFYIRIKVTDNAPASEIASAEITTGKIPSVVPADYSFVVKYKEIHGEPAPKEETITFQTTGKFDRKNIKIPAGYQAVNVPENPEEAWTYPTSLIYQDGKWMVSEEVVTIEVEKQASVRVKFQLKDGTMLDESYVDYYGEVSAGVIKAKLPEGYVAVDKAEYAVDVTRNEKGVLTADIEEVIITVKQKGNKEPEIPESTDKPENTQIPTQTEKPKANKNNADTGDYTNLVFLMMSMIGSGGVLLILIRKRRKLN